ncbi:hypothetical protein [Neorhodopirellula pilleata]|uniref:hypothetical protein n=1 Tax=Neorhodopirellula pilleata TaxID=2714738 RepID=UPI0011B6951E|nr:hypothetical protein [Neorhodopirellula pilleata]
MRISGKSPVAASQSPVNPYESPATTLSHPVDLEGSATSNDIVTRNRFLSHETSLKGIGLLSYLGAAIIIPLSFLTLIGFLLGGMQQQGFPIVAVFVLFVYLAIGIGQIFVARGIRRLENWARIAIGVFAIPGLIGIPVGTLISAYILFLCFSKKGRYVCSPEYRQVVANTPQIQYKTSVVVWVFVAILVIFIGLGLIAICAGAG